MIKDVQHLTITIRQINTMATAELECPIEGCTYKTGKASEAIACCLLLAHMAKHMPITASQQLPPTLATPAPCGPKLEHPKVDLGITPERWNIFKCWWNAFVVGSGIDPHTSSAQLLQCAGNALGDVLLKSDPDIVSKPTLDVMAVVKELAVVAVATGVTHAELVQLKQKRDESFRSFAARVHGKVETCQYKTKCTCTPPQSVDFTDIIIRGVLLAGIAHMDIRWDVLSTMDILDRPVNEVISLVKSKEMARGALPVPSAGFSSLIHHGSPSTNRPLPVQNRNQTGTCPDCKGTFPLFSESTEITGAGSDFSLSTTTRCVQPDKKASIHPFNGTEMP